MPPTKLRVEFSILLEEGGGYKFSRNLIVIVGNFSGSEAEAWYGVGREKEEEEGEEEKEVDKEQRAGEGVQKY